MRRYEKCIYIIAALIICTLNCHVHYIFGIDIEMNNHNSKEIEFTIPIRLPNSLSPVYVLYQKDEDPAESAQNFCRQIDAYNSVCVSSIYAAIKKRIDYLNKNDAYTLTTHKMKNVNYTKKTNHYFNALNMTDIIRGIEFFNKQGYVIFKNVATKKEVDIAKDLLWDYFESRFKAFQSKVETWDRIPANEYGIILQFGIGQSDFMWYLRTLPHVRQLFAKLWDINESDLIVDFGGPVVFRPVNCTKRWRTAEKWFHVDQNAGTYPGRQTIQSFLSLTKQTKQTGGIVVIPESWKYHNELTERARKHWGSDEHGQFLLVPPSDEVLNMKQPVFLHVDPGDMVFWDSRTVHCNTNSKKEDINEIMEEEVIKTVEVLNNDNGDDDDVVDLSEFVDKRQRVLDVITRLKNIREYNNFPINKECLDINNHDLKLQRIVALISMAPKAKAPDNVLALRRLAYVNEQTTT